MVQGGLISPVAFNLYLNEIPIHAGDDGNEVCELVPVFAYASRGKNVMAEVIYVVPHPVVRIYCDSR